MSISNILHSEAGLTLIGAILGGLWTFFKSTKLFDRLRRRRYDKALRALEAGVEHTYRTYVREIKAARQDGKLTTVERERARRLARAAAIEYGRDQGVDILRELGESYLDLWISKIVTRMKGATD